MELIEDAVLIQNGTKRWRYDNGGSTHEMDLPIFSIDIHPDGSRFATGGQGEDSGRIVIWNMAPVVSEKIENDENIPKMLCQMDNHLACVNCVRWSFSGRFLASGGDDKLVMIWKISKYASGGNTVFGSGKVNVETWRCATTLRGHNGDVLDMAWSPHDAWLATCSVDNTVIVWNALKMPEMVAVLKGHSGLVKGVAWDPVGKYVASQSDDKTLRIWRTADWQQDAVISEPFEECGGTTHVLRLSWSPDGQYLVSAHAMNGGGPTAQIVEREGWRQDKDFVGHRKAVTCVRFNSNILQKSYKSWCKPQQYCCCAIGSRDRSLSVWLTALKRPLVVIHELFSNSVLDLSWSGSGLQLMACSWDGSVAFVEFSEEELGKPLTLDEKSTLHERMYGKFLSPSARQTCVVETPELLEVREKQAEMKDPVVPANQTEPATEQPVTQRTPMKGPINKQIETRTSDGKRRITPMFIPPAPDSGDVPQPFGASGSQQPTFSSSSETKSRIVIEKRDDIVTPNVSGGSNSRPCDTTSAVSATPVVNSTSCPPTLNNQVLGQRITPNISDGRLEVQKVSRSVPPSVTTKRRIDTAVSVGTKLPVVKRSRPPVTSGSDKQLQPTSLPQSSGDEGLSGVGDVDSGPGLKLPPLRLQNGKGLVVRISGGNGLVKSRRLEVENRACGSSFGPLTKVRVFSDGCSSGDMPQWEAVLGYPVSGSVANSQLVVIACEDATLHLLQTDTGQRPLPPLVLSSPASRLALNASQQVMAVTCRGNLSVWDVLKGKALVRNESLLPIMQAEPGSVVTILSCSLTEEGHPLVSLSTGKAYMFSAELSSWLVLANSSDPVQRSSAHRAFVSTLSASQNTGGLPLACLQSHIISGVSLLGQGSSANALCTVTFMEQQLAACRALNSKQEFHSWLLALARFLTQEGLETRLRLICDDLLGPTHSHAKHSKSWDTSVMGFSKHALLREILPLIGSNLHLQRIYTEYSDQLAMLSEEK
ncbi:protein HIRA isoform X2 [Zootermopsis nevadensis]|uniref:protein HIRA isoform X2 n=1 Tax=Zootermopsis nevadensis TaxID=136037 RepID=UPI000B8E5B85|nr:protein HIRA isoform X2 [Zootermopsis nevadensis]